MAQLIIIVAFMLSNESVTTIHEISISDNDVRRKGTSEHETSLPLYRE
jgi:hypothetical protein